jgi:signal transduction histidine kinase/FixJ family two-component response regulator/HAMP domain-containing protein
MGFTAGLAALVAAWYGGERFILRHVRVLYEASRQLASGDLTSRTGMGHEKGEFGELARTFDQMAATLQQRAGEQEETSHNLLNRALQQTVVAALGQYALVTNDLGSLLNQATMLVAQTLETEFCSVLECDKSKNSLTLSAGVGWRDGCIGNTTPLGDASTQDGFALATGEPLVVTDLSSEMRFRPSLLLRSHEVTSSISVVISTRGVPFGLLGAHTSRHREFTGDEVHFMLSVAAALGMAVERLQSEAQMLKLATFAQLNPNPALELSADGKITYHNDAALRLTLTMKKSHPSEILPPHTAQIVHDCLNSTQDDVRLRTEQEQRTLSWWFHPVPASGVVHCYVEDITERLSLESQLLQSQKMESIGQLAAGVAHDFNNMLTIIQGHAGLMASRPNVPREIQESAQAISFAADRSAGLTRQLLVFSRKSVMQVKSLDLRDTVGQLGKMLRRMVGETITLEFEPPAALPIIHADAGMIEQILMNLVVNARDAMPRGGTVLVCLGEMEIDQDYVESHPQTRLGHFVCLRVSDTGMGMDAATQARIFEPFFTTKEVGKGTGLGLATVYGIVKQHEGWIEVESEVGVGTTFLIFFPAAQNTVAAATEARVETTACEGHETVLVVEDEPVLRDLAQMILNECGYRVLTASTGPEALDVWSSKGGVIDLLLTDMVMPDGLSGVDLAEKLIQRKPSLRIIFTSGYTMDEMSTSFLKKHNNARYLQKPYNRDTLTRTVRQVLDQPAAQPQPQPAARPFNVRLVAAA